MRRTKIIQRHQVPAKQRLGYDYNVLRNEQELVVVENKTKNNNNKFKKEKNTRTKEQKKNSSKQRLHFHS